MTTLNYLDGRKKYTRPQALLFADFPGTTVEGENGLVHVPVGNELGVDVADASEGTFLILSDHNRSAIDVKYNRIGQKERTINGKMRSFFVADKRTFSISWQNLPSRAFSSFPDFNSSTGLPSEEVTKYTVDGGAGGNELLNWHLIHPQSFYLFISYDSYIDFLQEDNTYGRLREYQEVKEVYLSDFDYVVNKRSPNTYDLWNVSITLEEV